MGLSAIDDGADELRLSGIDEGGFHSLIRGGFLRFMREGGFQ